MPYAEKSWDRGTRLQPKLPASNTWTKADPGVLRGSRGPDPPPSPSRFPLAIVSNSRVRQIKIWELRAPSRDVSKRETGSGERENENWEQNVTRTLALSVTWLPILSIFSISRFPLPVLVTSLRTVYSKLICKSSVEVMDEKAGKNKKKWTFRLNRRGKIVAKSATVIRKYSGTSI